MSDVQWLFAVLAGLYFWECACWLRRGSVAVTTWLGRRWRVWHPGTLLGNQRGGFVFAVPLPPLGTFLTASQFPLSLSPAGVLFFVATSLNPGGRPLQSGRLVNFDDFHEVHSKRRKLIVNGEVAMTGLSPGFARHLADILQRLWKTQPVERERVIGEIIRAALDDKAVAKRWQEAQLLVRPVRWLANGLLVYLFVLAPVLIWQLGFGLTWAGLLLGLLAFTTATAIYFRRAHGVLFPEAEEERFSFTLTVLLAPTTALRAHDLLLRPCCETFQPLAIARVFLPPDGFAEFARHGWRDLAHPARPVCPPGPPEVEAIEAHGRTAMRSAVEKFLRESGCDPEKLSRPPQPLDEACRGYCPRCEAQFTNLETACADCGGMPLEPFAESSRDQGTA